jgi:hypothetical protein
LKSSKPFSVASQPVYVRHKDRRVAHKRIIGPCMTVGDDQLISTMLGDDVYRQGGLLLPPQCAVPIASAITSARRIKLRKRALAASLSVNCATDACD